MKAMMAVASLAAGAMMIGCSTVNPRAIPQTSRDLETYKPVAERPVPAGQYRIVLVTKVDNKLPPDPAKMTPAQLVAYTQMIDSETRNACSRELEMIPYVAEQMDTSLAQNFHNLGWFETIDRKRGFGIEGESVLRGEKALDLKSYAAADIVLFADSHLTWVAPQGWKTTSNAGKARGAAVKTDFRLFDVRTKEPILVKQITTTVADNGKGRDMLKQAIQKCCDQNAAKFSRIVAAKFLPEVRVRETRGGGRYALVAMGQNYQAKPATASWKWWPYKYLPLCYLKTEDVPATRVDFCYTEKEAGAGGKTALESVNFAHGEVLESDAKTAWVEVADYETAGVKKGHSAVVSDRTIDGQEIQ